MSDHKTRFPAKFKVIAKLSLIALHFIEHAIQVHVLLSALCDELHWKLNGYIFIRLL